MESDERRYCLCGQTYDATRDMIQCDGCKEWYHQSCVDLQEYLVPYMDKFHCPKCIHIAGPSVFKEQTNWHRHDPTEQNADSRPVQSGTTVFIEELKLRHFPSCEGIIVTMKGEELSVPYLKEHGFDRPIIIKDKKGLGMKIPEKSIWEVASYIDSERKVDVIDVIRQTTLTMPFKTFIDYFCSPFSKNPFNLISLEISDTRLSELVEAPTVARELDWVNSAWPERSECDKPAVQKYCLIGMRDSYTDFHIDFGGTSVWYHVYKGQKIFYLIKPTPANLSLYQRWTLSATHSEMFFGDQVDMCYRCVLNEGETMLIPTGWIHAVLTPETSLVYGGNFLHSLNIPMQLQIYEMERRAQTPNKFCYPAFETINWYAAGSILMEMKELNKQGKKLPDYLAVGIKALLLRLKRWYQERDVAHKMREKIPNGIDVSKLFKELNKEIRLAERYLISLNPPKPERESKRKKKKPINDDFVDFSYCPNLDECIEPKDHVRLTIRTVPKLPFQNKKPVGMQRPPLKLTLPKPAMYPYSINKLENFHMVDSINASDEINSTLNPTLNDNVDSTYNGRFLDDEPHQSKTEGELKLKIARSQIVGENIVSSADSLVNDALQNHSEEDNIDPIGGSSVYDFHDDSDEEEIMAPASSDISYLPSENDTESDSDSDRLIIRERSLPNKRIVVISNDSPLRMRLSNMYKNAEGGQPEDAVTPSSTTDEDSFETPKNGIEELLKASGYADEPQDRSARSVDIDSGRASPSTREAIAGMLSISGSFLNEAGSSKADLAPRLQGKNSQLDEEGLEAMGKVHQDEDYIYPAIDTSDDEDNTFKSRGKRNMDESWSPRARLGPLLPKTDRPLREGTKKQCVEKVLEAAAAKRAVVPVSEIPPKRPYNKKKVKYSAALAQQPTSTVSALGMFPSARNGDIQKWSVLMESLGYTNWNYFFQEKKMNRVWK
ncbi:lysine-specific demethylase phf2-like isoform X2 [Schistocerca nitens]|uniref:lysine-specific demethylase phf2-like isoform X2 n=1 Tax=Schistocerca nitens TaxID=7011 RepID=UPI002119A881|nr:lysine-specific demethylase phf2-like isoform X2 [Schistocerca nitens]